MTGKQFLPKALSLGLLLLTATTAYSDSSPLPCQYGDDGLGGPCCETGSPNLPHFPASLSKGSYACITKCTDVSDFQVKVNVSELDWFTCDMAWVKVSVTPGSITGPKFSGKIIAKYSRTWVLEETGQQVWRFLLNGDMKYSASLGVFGCPQPPHANPTHFTGHIDYTCDIDSADISPDTSLSLNHLPGCVSHGPLSARPLAGAAAHNERSYHLVTPSGFNWLAASALEGRTPAEAFRPSYQGDCFPYSYKCMNEVPIVDGEIATSHRDCLCLDHVAGNWNHQKMYGRGDCNGSPLWYQTVDGFDPSIPVGMLTLPLGQWGTNTWMQGVELSIHQGYMKVENPCFDQPVDDYERFHGATTYGHKARTFQHAEQTVFKVWMDLQNHRLPPTDFEPECLILTPGFGAPAYSTMIWNLNIL